MSKIRSTTVVAVRRGKSVAVASDGQVTLGQTIVKGDARKLRRLCNGKVLVGFAGAGADALTLIDRFEAKLETYKGALTRSAVELAKDWRMDKFLRRLEAMIVAADSETMLLVSGTGDVIEATEGIVAIGSGGSYALAAARALVRHTELAAPEVARRALEIAAEICVYTNANITLETLES